MSQLCAPLHMVQTSDLRFQTSWQTGAMRSGPSMLAYHLAIVLDVLLGFAHYGGKPVGGITPNSAPDPLVSVRVTMGSYGSAGKWGKP